MDIELAGALSHPLRVKILDRLSRKAHSSAQLSRDLDVSISSVSYHIGRLRNAGFIEEVSSRPVRGAIEHFYLISERYVRALGQLNLPPGVEGRAGVVVMRKLIEEITAAIEEGTLAASKGGALAVVPLCLDPTGCREIRKALDKMREKAMLAHERSADRLARGGGSGCPTTVVFGGFESGLARRENSDAKGA